MEKLKIVINGNKEIAGQAKDLFKILGYYITTEKRDNFYGWSLGERCGDYYGDILSFNKDPARSVNIQELRDMVVLKRNDVGDAQFKDNFGDKWYIDSENAYWMFEGEVWRKALPPKFKLKPIKGETMKEYLTKNSSGNYQLVNHSFSEDDIEIPQGANYAATNGHGIFFSDKNDFIPDLVVWVRESINDKIATAEVARQEEKHSHYKKDVSHLSMIDPYRIADLYDLHPCAEHIMKKSLCAGNRGHKDMLRDIQDIIDTAERWKQMIEEDNNEI